MTTRTETTSAAVAKVLDLFSLSELPCAVHPFKTKTRGLDTKWHLSAQYLQLTRKDTG